MMKESRPETMLNSTRVMTVKEVGAYLRVHPTTIYRLLKRNEIPGFKVGGDYRFNRESIDRWRLGQRSAVDEKI